MNSPLLIAPRLQLPNTNIRASAIPRSIESQEHALILRFLTTSLLSAMSTIPSLAAIFSLITMASLVAGPSLGPVHPLVLLVLLGSSARSRSSQDVRAGKPSIQRGVCPLETVSTTSLHVFKLVSYPVVIVRRQRSTLACEHGCTPSVSTRCRVYVPAGVSVVQLVAHSRGGGVAGGVSFGFC